MDDRGQQRAANTRFLCAVIQVHWGCRVLSDRVYWPQVLHWCVPCMSSFIYINHFTKPIYLPGEYN